MRNDGPSMGHPRLAGAGVINRDSQDNWHCCFMHIIEYASTMAAEFRSVHENRFGMNRTGIELKRIGSI